MSSGKKEKKKNKEKNNKNNNKKNNKKIVSVVISAVILVAAALVLIFVLWKPFDNGGGNKNTGGKKPVTDNSAGSAKVVLVPAEGTGAVSEDDLNTAAEIIAKRLDFYDFDKSDLTVDANVGSITADLSWSGKKTDFDVNAVIREIKVKYASRLEKGVNAGLTPSDAENIVLETPDIGSAKADTVTEDGKQRYRVDVTFTEAGAQKYIAATEELAGTGTQLAFWIDNAMMYAETVEEKASDGVMTLRSNFISLDEAEKVAEFISAGALPFELETGSFNKQ